MCENANIGVLIVDYNIEYVQLVREVLLSGGFENVHVAYDGLECLAILENLGDQIHVIALGLAMPGMTGFDVMQELSLRRVSPAGIVMWTGQASDDNRNVFFSHGSDNVLPSAFIYKGESPDVLIQGIRNAAHVVKVKRFGVE